MVCLFDGQSETFDRRAGLPDESCREIARSVVEIGEASPDDLVIEVGCGTGQIANWFGASVRYLGFDLSSGMLAEFRRRSDNAAGCRLLAQADARAFWPMTDGVAKVIFSSRTAHLLEHEWVASEAFRIASSSGAMLILGRVERDPESIKERMARKMIELLRDRGFEGRRGDRQNRKLVDSFNLRGAQILDPVPVAKWRISASPGQSLDSWGSLEGLGGIPVPAETRAGVLRELEAWAKGEFGELDRESECEEIYVLKPLRLPADRGARYPGEPRS